MPATLQDAITWIVTRLNTDATLTTTLSVVGTYMYSAPEVGVSSYPFIIIQKQAGAHKTTMCSTAYDTHFLAIKCIDRGFDGGKSARTVMERVRVLLEHQTATLSSGRIIAIIPNNSYEYDEQESGNNNFYHSVISFKVVVA